MTIRPSELARVDLASGLGDVRLVELLALLASERHVGVRLIKTGHPMGPRSPAGRENDHYFYRAADIDSVNGVPVVAAPASEGLVAIAGLLMGLSMPLRPVGVMGPVGWHRALPDGDRSGFRDDAIANKVHNDHLHLGY
jgi:hypothetical protein